MQRLNSNTTVTAFAGVDGDVQLVIGSRGLIVLDAQGAERGTDGVLRHNHGTVRLTFDAACELRQFLDQIDEPADDRQPRLWSDTTFVDPIRPPACSRRRRRPA
jgi:hypothetical protein